MHGEGRLPPFNESTQLIDIFGPPQGYNNLNEPKPFTNEPATLIGFVVSFLAVSWLFVCFRLYVRIRVLRTPGWDDFFVVLYLVSGLDLGKMGRHHSNR